MKVKPGYNQTEVGVIPEDWDVKPLKELFTFSGGLSASREQLSDDGFCYLHYGDIHKSNKMFIDVANEYDEIPKLNIPLKSVPTKALLSDGDVVFVDASEDDDGASKHIVVRNPNGITYISGLHTIVAKSKDDSLCNIYKQYCFQTRDIKRQFKYYAVGTKVTGISKTNIVKIQIPLPPRPEQRVIAEALSDADALVESLEQLIAKKRDIKQGAMQELLTGKRRLPGFSDEWEIKKLGELLDYEQPTKYIVKDTEYSDNYNIPVLTAGKTFILGYTVEEFSIFRNLPVIIFDDFTTASKYVDFPFKVKSSAMKILKPRDKNVNLKFVFEKMQLIDFNLGDHKRYWISEYQNIEIDTPTYEEKIAIAAVLSDIDAEIVALEEKRDKCKQIKHGMMQELLTGETRLIS